MCEAVIQNIDDFLNFMKLGWSIKQIILGVKKQKLFCWSYEIQYINWVYYKRSNIY